jgi:hypothetical protein
VAKKSILQMERDEGIVFLVVGVASGVGALLASGFDEGCFSLLLMVLCFVCIAGGVPKLTRARRVKKYITWIGDERKHTLHMLAERSRWSVEFIRGDLKEVRDKGFFTASGLNGTVDRILGVVPAETSSTKTPASAATPPPPTDEAVRCASCNAAGIKRVGKVSRCEYCDSPL